MFCPKCGKENKDGAAFCSSCGAPLATTTQTPAVVSPDSQGADATVNESSFGGFMAKILGLPGKAKIGIVAGIVVVIAIIIILALLLNGGVPKSTVEDDVMNSSIFSSIKSTQYVDDSEVTLSEFKIDSNKKYQGSDASYAKAIIGSDVYYVTFSGKAENANFSSDFSGEAYYVKSNGKWTSLGGPYATSNTVTPLKGIDFDTEHDLGDATIEFDADKKTCSADKTESFGFWFADVEQTTHYGYTFKNNAWAFDSEAEPTRTITYKDIDGDYAAKSDLPGLTAFKISNLDPAKGTFTIDTTINTETTFSFSGGTTKSDIVSTLTATIDPRTDVWLVNGDDDMEDGYTYSFKATGSSSSGNGEAVIEGYFANSNSGESKIQITNYEVDYTYSWSTGNSDSRTTHGSGSIYKVTA